MCIYIYIYLCEIFALCTICISCRVTSSADAETSDVCTTTTQRVLNVVQTRSCYFLVDRVDPKRSKRNFS